MIIGICGQGFVGTAVREGLRDFYDLKTFDISKKEDFAVDTLEDLAYLNRSAVRRALHAGDFNLQT